MDDLDHELRLRLTKDAHASVTDLSQALNVSRGTVQNRIEKLWQRDVIRRFTVELGQAEVDHQISAFALLRLKTDGDQAVRDTLYAMAETRSAGSSIWL